MVHFGRNQDVQTHHRRCACHVVTRLRKFLFPTRCNFKDHSTLNTCRVFNVLGVQGALAANLFDPIYMNTIVIGDVPEDMRDVVREDCERAFFGRLESIKGTFLPFPMPFVMQMLCLQVFQNHTSLQNRLCISRILNSYIRGRPCKTRTRRNLHLLLAMNVSLHLVLFNVKA